MPARWPIEQEKYLEDAWGEVSIPYIAQKLGRTVNAVKLKARKMGLKRHIHSGSYITLNQLFNALDISYNAFTLDRWRRHGFPLRHKKSVNMRYKIVYIKDFWAWAERHKMFIDFSRVEPLIFGPEPAWVKHKRKADWLAKPYRERRPWTPQEDAQFKAMLCAYRYTYRDISVALKRTEGALKRRFRDLKLKQRPLPADKSFWTPEQEKVLEDLYYKGYIPEVMAEYIPKSASAIQRKVERMVAEGRFAPDRFREEKEPEKQKKPWGNYIFVSAGVSYKKVLPPEKWPLIEHFLASFCGLAMKADETGEKVDVNKFIKEYMQIYVKGSEEAAML